MSKKSKPKRKKFGKKHKAKTDKALQKKTKVKIDQKEKLPPVSSSQVVSLEVEEEVGEEEVQEVEEELQKLDDNHDEDIYKNEIITFDEPLKPSNEISEDSAVSKQSPPRINSDEVQVTDQVVDSIEVPTMGEIKDVSSSKANEYYLDQLTQDQVFEGFFSKSTKTDEFVEVITTGILTSDDSKFYDYIDQIKCSFFDKLGISADSTSKFLIVIHSNSTAHIYINDFPVKIRVGDSTDLLDTALIEDSDIRSLKKVTFPEIEIKKTDKIIFCFKVKWKFGLFFFLDPFNPLSLDWLSLKIASLYKRLMFEYIYLTLESKIEFMKMMIDGWFPFIELLGEEFDELKDIYSDELDHENRKNFFIAAFDKSRIDSITFKWWQNPIYEKQQSLIESGLIAYLKNNKEGYIFCIKKLIKEIEGVIRFRYFKETGKGGKVSLAYLLTYLIERGKTQSSQKDLLFIPEYFYKYLKEIVFSVFNFETDKIDSSSMDFPEDYLKTRALQTILILDQIYQYLL